MRGGARREGNGAYRTFTIDLTEHMGRMMLFVLSSFAWLTRPPFRFYQIVKQLNFIGYKSTFVVVLTVFTGMVLALQGYYTFAKIRVGGPCLPRPWHSASFGSWVPVLAALMVTARAGSAMTAEIGIMNHRTDRRLGYDGRESVVISDRPKLVASLIAVPLLVALFDVVGIYGGYVVGVQLLNGNEGAY